MGECDGHRGEPSSGDFAFLTVKTGGEFRTRRSLDIGDLGPVAIDATGRIAVGEGFFGLAGTLRVGNLGELAGNGVIKGNVVVGDNGHLEPGFGVATLQIEGSYKQHVGGFFDVEIGGAAAKTDLLKVTGSAVVGGTLNVTLVNGFNPKTGQKFKVMTAASRTGTFDTVNGATVEYTDDGFVVDPIVPPTTLTVTIDPTNPTLGGQVSAGFLGTTDRNVGFTYKITAKPATGFVFAG